MGQEFGASLTQFNLFYSIYYTLILFSFIQDFLSKRWTSNKLLKQTKIMYNTIFWHPAQIWVLCTLLFTFLAWLWAIMYQLGSLFLFTVQIIWPIKVLSKMLYNYMCNIYNDLLHALMLCVVSGHLLDWHITLITWISNSFMCWGFVSSELSCLSE